MSGPETPDADPKPGPNGSPPHVQRTTSGRSSLSQSQKRFAVIVIAFGIASAAYRLVYWTDQEKTAALFVGVPTVLALLLGLSGPSRSATGSIIRNSTLAMMVAAIALPEGLVCLIFAFPLVSCIALIVGGSVDRARAKEKRKGPTLMFVGIPLLVLSLEGVVGSPFASADHVRSSITVAMSPSAVAAALAAPPRFDRKMPRFLRFGFNRPIASTGGGIRVGDHRVVEFVGGAHDDHPLHLFGFTGHSGTRHHATMALRVVRSANDEVVYAIEQDNTMLARWVALRTATVHWTPLGPERTKVTWSFDYDRLISPAFYFAPLQRYGMTEAARYLLLSTVARR